MRALILVPMGFAAVLGVVFLFVGELALARICAAVGGLLLMLDLCCLVASDES